MTPRRYSAALLATALLSGPAATLPRAAADRHATGCEAFGPDFRRIEGTETCIRISGAVRAEAGLSTSGGARR